MPKSTLSVTLSNALRDAGIKNTFKASGDNRLVGVYSFNDGVRVCATLNLLGIDYSFSAITKLDGVDIEVVIK